MVTAALPPAIVASTWLESRAEPDAESIAPIVASALAVAVLAEPRCESCGVRIIPEPTSSDDLESVTRCQRHRRTGPCRGVSASTPCPSRARGAHPHGQCSGCAVAWYETAERHALGAAAKAACRRAADEIRAAGAAESAA